MKPIKCKICGYEHSGVNHIFDAINKPAINKTASDRTPNRQDRATYNTYMREYMRKRRA